MIFTDEEIQQVLWSDNWSVTKDLQQIAQDYNYPIGWITPDMGQTFDVDVIKAAMNEIGNSFAPRTIYMNPDDIQRYFAGQKFLFKIRRNLNRKSKSHFRK